MKRDRIMLPLIVLFAIFVRSIPILTNFAWGNDLGIYYGIATRMIREKVLFVDYDGWGNSYQYFPVIYLISLVAHLLTGFDLLWIMARVAPIIGGLTVLIFYFIILEITRNKKLSLLSSSLLAVAPFHVYQTSHAAPLTLGHFFMLLSIYFFIKSSKKAIYFIPLFFSTTLLILSHHLTTYFYIISATSILLFMIYDKRCIDKGVCYSLVYLLLASGITFSYWAIIAKPVFYNYLPGGIPLPPHHIIILYYLSLLLGIVMVLRWRKIAEIARFHKEIGIGKKFLTTFFIILGIEMIFACIPFPKVNVRINLLTTIYSIPIIAFFSSSVSGISELRKTKGGRIILGWIVAIFLSLIYSLIYQKTNIYPDRHLEYIIVPLCLPAAISIIKLSNILYDRLLHLRIKGIGYFHAPQIALSLLVGLILISNAIAVYPAYDTLNAADERITEPCISAIRWAKGNISKSCVIASDHRLSMLLWAEGFNITMGETNLTWTAKNFSSCLEEIERLNISYILIDDIMKEKVVNVDVGKYFYMDNESYEKFLREPFELVYRNATLNDMGEEIHWAEIYRINFSYLGMNT